MWQSRSFEILQKHSPLTRSNASLSSQELDIQQYHLTDVIFPEDDDCIDGVRFISQIKLQQLSSDIMAQTKNLKELNKKVARLHVETRYLMK